MAVAGPLLPGDILVADNDGGVIRVDPITGTQTTISSGGLFSNPLDLAINSEGSIFVADSTGDPASSVGVIRVNPLTGAQTLIAPAGTSSFPIGITTDGADNLFVSFYGGGFGKPGESGGIIRLDSTTGSQTIVSPAGSFVSPFGITVDPAGNLIVVDNDPFAFINRFVRVDPITGAQTTFSSGSSNNPQGVAVDADGNVFATLEAGFGSPDGAVIRVDPITGARTVVSSGGFLADPLGIAIDIAGNLLITDVNDFGPGRIIRIDPVTGAQSLLSEGGSLINPIGIVLVPQALVVPEPGGVILWLTGAMTMLICSRRHGKKTAVGHSTESVPWPSKELRTRIGSNDSG